MPVPCFMLRVFLSLDECDRTASHKMNWMADLFVMYHVLSPIYMVTYPQVSPLLLLFYWLCIIFTNLFSITLIVFAAAGFASRTRYLFGRMSIQMKVHAGDSSGTVSTFYVSTSTCLSLHYVDYAAWVTVWQPNLQWMLKTGQGVCALSRKLSFYLCLWASPFPAVTVAVCCCLVCQFWISVLLFNPRDFLSIYLSALLQILCNLQIGGCGHWYSSSHGHADFFFKWEAWWAGLRVPWEWSWEALCSTDQCLCCRCWRSWAAHQTLVWSDRGFSHLFYPLEQRYCRVCHFLTHLFGLPYVWLLVSLLTLLCTVPKVILWGSLYCCLCEFLVQFKGLD